MNLFYYEFTLSAIMLYILIVFKNWHAIKSDLMTRHCKFTKIFTADNETEIYLKNNIDKFQ